MTYAAQSPRTLTVTAVNSYIKALLVSDGNLSDIWVEGEISNFKRHISGHCYFTLKDAESVLKCVMFRTAAARLPFLPENGMKVLARGNISVYERDGAYQLYVEHIEAGGTGALYIAFEQLKAKLSREGLFDPAHKKPIPRLPQRVGVITSPTGAVIKDIMNVTYRRFPTMRLALFPVSVQGTEASGQIADALRFVNEKQLCDVIILARGGGSLEELWAFNEERTARAVYGSGIPVISAVGHEVDFTIADFVADLRAPTPSAAAELCAPDIRDLKERVLQQRAALDRQLQARFTHLSQSLSGLQKRLGSMEPDKQIELYCQRLSGLQKRLELSAGRTVSLWEQKHSQLVQNLYRNGRQLVEKKEERCFRQMAALEALSPLKVLTRGYSITRSAAGKILYSPDQVKDGDKVTTRLAQGELVSIVQKEQGGTEKEAPAPALEGGDSHGGKNL